MNLQYSRFVFILCRLVGKEKLVQYMNESFIYFHCQKPFPPPSISLCFSWLTGQFTSDDIMDQSENRMQLSWPIRGQKDRASNDLASGDGSEMSMIECVARESFNNKYRIWRRAWPSTIPTPNSGMDPSRGHN